MAHSQLPLDVGRHDDFPQQGSHLWLPLPRSTNRTSTPRAFEARRRRCVLSRRVCGEYVDGFKKCFYFEDVNEKEG